GNAGVDRKVPLLFFLVVVGDTGAFLDAAAPVDGLGFEQQGVRQGSFACRTMSDEGKIADIFRSIVGHACPQLSMIADGRAAVWAPSPAASPHDEMMIVTLRDPSSCRRGDGCGQLEPPFVQRPADDTPRQAKRCQPADVVERTDSPRGDD